MRQSHGSHMQIPCQGPGSHICLLQQDMQKAALPLMQPVEISSCASQIHFPFPFFKQTTLADGLQEAMDLGLTAAVGVCNYNTAQLEELHGLLSKKDIPLATNQVACPP